MTKKPKVFLTGGDMMGWALDEDLKLVRQALQEQVEFVDLASCDVVHSVWWEGLVDITDDRLYGKRVICHIPSEPHRYLMLPKHRHVMPLVGQWIVRTVQAKRQLEELGIPSRLIPYIVDLDTFSSKEITSSTSAALRAEWGIPSNRYLIGNYHRDSEGANPNTPKLVKGPDVFLEILRVLHQREEPVHVLLAGPRRHWLRSQLSAYGIPFSFIGHPVETDDLRTNMLSRETLNVLYHLLDLFLVSSRSEGGPHSIMEGAATRCKILSTRVGLAEDILDPASIFDTPAQAVNVIAQDIRDHHLDATLDRQYDLVQQHHSLEAVKPLFQQMYLEIETVPVYARPDVRKKNHIAKRKSIFTRAMNILRTHNQLQSSLEVGLWHKFSPPPYGGGNQFMLALKKSLQQQGVKVTENELKDSIDSYVLNSIHFDVDRFQRFASNHRLKVVHRIDGPIHLIRGYDRDKDELTYHLNKEFASATVIQSAWTYQRIVEFGYQPVNPVIIHNAVDPNIFHPHGRVPLDRNRKIRLISSSWSDNPRKGGPIYKAIEKKIDRDRFEYTFVGRASETFDHIKQIDPVPSKDLANILRLHDIYITASENDPCSNALIEALACGLPALYLNSGGHPELVGYGGLPFTTVDDFLSSLDTLVNYYEMYQNTIVVESLEDVANKYFILLKEIAE